MDMTEKQRIMIQGMDVFMKRLEFSFRNDKDTLKILKDMGAPDVVLKGCEEEIEKLLHPKVKEKKYSIKYAGSYLENQKNRYLIKLSELTEFEETEIIEESFEEIETTYKALTEKFSTSELYKFVVFSYIY